ncbi:MAG: DNA polymerase III subunit gamma/tau [Alistipes sp.]
MENFVVSARKYRPATFASVVGQQHITLTLKNAIERGQLAHAYLFCGPRGVGKTTCARIFAKAINCLHPQQAEACNECESCRSFNENRSLNIRELDAASNNSVDDIRSLIEQVRIIPQIGRYSVFIIDEVHMLSPAAFNAFLKTLEEPPAHAIFILATTEKHKIIPTILSRCQIYDFNRIRVEDSVEYLKYILLQEEISADDESLNLIAQKADGSMRDALSMFDKAVSFCGRTLHFKEVAQTLNVLDYDTYFGVTDLLRAGNYVEALLAFDGVLTQGFSGQTFMAGLNRHLRDLLVAKNAATVSLLEVTGTLLERYRRQAEACDVGFLFSAISVLTDLDGKIRQSSNQRLLVELGLMKIAGLGQKKNELIGTFEPESFPLPKLVVRKTSESSTVVTTPEALKAPVVVQSEPVPPQPKEAPETTDKTATTVALPTPRRARTPLVSLSELMQTPAEEVEADEEVETETDVEMDEACAERLEAKRTEILTCIQEMRPRFVATFERMLFEGYTIRLSVPSAELREEILRNRTELLLRIMEVTGIRGKIDIAVTVNEKITAKLPIKLEDRVKYICDKNPLVTQLRKVLDLETE